MQYKNMHENEKPIVGIFNLPSIYHFLSSLIWKRIEFIDISENPQKILASRVYLKG